MEQTTDFIKTKKEPQNTKQTSILIEVVDNGFVVKEDFYPYHDRMNPTATANPRKVFNTKKQLYNYISNNL